MKGIKQYERLIYLINLCTILVILLSLFVFGINNLFNINSIIIKGNLTHITQLNLANIAKNRLNDTLLTLNIEKLKQNFEHLSWVKKAQLERIFPHTLLVNIEEHQVLAKLDDGSLISTQGDVFVGNNNNTEQLPIFYVSVNNINFAVLLYNQLLLQLKSNNDSSYILELILIDQKIVSLKLSDGFKYTICNDITTTFLRALKLKTIITHKYHKFNNMNFCYENAVAISESK